MTIEKARELLGEEFSQFSDDEIKNLIELIDAVCKMVIHSKVEKE